MWSLNGSFFPLEEIKWLKNFELGSRVFFYHKAKDSGPISDTAATRSSQNLGWEWDLYCNWAITSDLSWTLRYGAFQPGGAFEDRDCRQFLLTGITLSF